MIYKTSIKGDKLAELIKLLNLPASIKEEVEVIIKPKDKIDFSNFKIDSFKDINAVKYQKVLRDEWQ